MSAIGIMWKAKSQDAYYNHKKYHTRESNKSCVIFKIKFRIIVKELSFAMTLFHKNQKIN